jgi:hypothetical protein
VEVLWTIRVPPRWCEVDDHVPGPRSVHDVRQHLRSTPVNLVENIGDLAACANQVEGPVLGRSQHEIARLHARKCIANMQRRQSGYGGSSKHHGLHTTFDGVADRVLAQA